MQDLIFYVAANETLGAVRDYANMRNESAPTLVLGVSVCLRMRLFTERNVATPYPISAFSGISAWNWSMDGDYDHSTACKLTADAGSITVHSVSDTINGETMTFTEFVIPISAMNTEELAAWLGTAESKRGLTGELVGYDTDGNAVFVLQIENFTVRNRVTGIGEPTAQDQELVTRTEAQSMILYAISGATIDVSNVTSAASAGYAVSAGSAASAGSATSAGSAGSAGSATSAGSAGSAGSATSAGYASSAGGLTTAAMTTVVNSAAAAVNITSVSEAGVASSLTSAAKADILASAGGGSGSGGVIVYSGGTADYASSAGGLTSDAMNAVVGSAAASATSAAWIVTPTDSLGTQTLPADGSYVSSNSAYTLLSSGGSAINGGVTLVGKVVEEDDSSKLIGALNEFGVPTVNAVISHVSSQINNPYLVELMTVSGSNGYTNDIRIQSDAVSRTQAITKVIALNGFGPVARVDTINSAFGGDSSLNAFAVPTVNAVVAFVDSKIAASGGGTGEYEGPFAVSISNGSIVVAGGRMYLGGAEYAVASSTLTSSNGTVYYYVYYSGGSYYSGCSVAASASALAAVIRGSQGYYTALANVQGGSVTQCHFGDIRIDGRVQ